VGHQRARLIITDPDAATNPKVAQLLALERAASGEVVVVSDSNVRVTPRYLDPLLAELSSPGVGTVSNVVAGTGERTLGAAMENLQFGAVIAPGIVASAFVLGKTITLGKSVAMWRQALENAGGFARVAHLLSDDHMLGQAFARAGYQVRVSLWPVENRNVDCTLERTIARHTRWAQTRRALSPVAFAIEPALSPVVITTNAHAAHDPATMAPSPEKAPFVVVSSHEVPLAAIGVLVAKCSASTASSPGMAALPATKKLHCWSYGAPPLSAKTRRTMLVLPAAKPLASN
jgi:hypothetical protein